MRTPELDFYLKSTTYPVLCATLGVNGNGGYTADADDLLAEGNLDEYSQVAIDPAVWERHLSDAGWEGIGEAHEWAAFDRHALDKDGYLTGEIHRIYLDLGLGGFPVQTHTNAHGDHYYSTLRDGKRVFSWTKDFADIWHEEE